MTRRNGRKANALVLAFIIFPFCMVALQILLFGPHTLSLPTLTKEAATFLGLVLIGCGILQIIHGVESKAEALTQSKEKLLEMVSHDLKNPITSILMATELLRTQSDCNPKIISIIRRNCQTMLGLIDSLLTAGSVENGKLKLYRQVLVVRDVIAEVAGTMEPLLLNKKIQLLTEIEGGLTCFCDLNRLKQILSNLISNAIQYSPEGSAITIKAYRRIEAGRNVHFVVQDNGPGINAESLNDIFEPYVRTDDNPNGHGLGLAIVKQLVSAHGGIVWAESMGRGTRIYFKMPDERLFQRPDHLVPDRPAYRSEPPRSSPIT